MFRACRGRFAEIADTTVGLLTTDFEQGFG